MEVLLNQILRAFIALQVITQVLSLSCGVNYFNKAWEQDWRLLLTPARRDQYELFRGAKVATNRYIVMVCNNNNRPITVSCNANQRFSEALPLQNKCSENESLWPARTTEEVAYCPYKLHKIGFYVRIGGETQFQETYRICFDWEHMRPLFTINMAYPVGGGRPSFLQFNPDEVFNGRLFSAFSRRATFERFNQLLGSNQHYMDKNNLDHVIDRGHLTPSADFTLTNLKRSTFNMMNVVPQFKTIDNGNWRLIEEWARKPSHTPAHICTGVLDCRLNSANINDLHCVVQLRNKRGENVPMFLADNRKIPIPSWVYKIVKTDQTSLVFLTLNNIYFEGTVPVPTHICREIPCPINLSTTVKDGRTFCCEYNDFIARSVPYLKSVC